MSSGATKTFAQSLIINEGMSSQPAVGLFFKSFKDVRMSDSLSTAMEMLDRDSRGMSFWGAVKLFDCW